MTNPMKQRGGARPGAGRPPGQPAKLNTPATNDPLVFLQQVMNDGEAEIRLRVAAAVALMPFIHTKKGEGVKDAKQDAAKKAGAGRFGASKPPMLVINNP